MKLRGLAFVVLAGCGGASAPCPSGDAVTCVQAARGTALDERLARWSDACHRLAHAPACRLLADAMLLGEVARDAAAKGTVLQGASSPMGQGVAALDRACELGDGEACHDLGMRALSGLGVPRDLDRAAERFEEGCAHDHGQSCLDAGLVAVQGGGTPSTSFARFQKSCDLGFAQGCTRLGLAHEQGMTGDADVAAALRAYARGCDLGFAAGCGLAAILVDDEGRAGADPAARRRFLMSGAAQGDWQAMAHLAEADDISAAEEAVLHQVHDWACAEGIAESCHVLGMLRDVRGDDGEAVARWRQACDAGDGVACGRLAARARSGRIEADPAWRLAKMEAAGCAAGWAPGCVAWGQTLVDGSEVEGADLPAAFDAFSRACARGDARGCAARQKLADAGLGRRVDAPMRPR